VVVVGLVGAGRRGNGHLNMLQWMKEQGDNIEIAAICDIYKPRLETTARKYNAKSYSSYHELLAEVVRWQWSRRVQSGSAANHGRV